MANNGSKKFLFVTNWALAFDLAYRVKQEGHKVKFYISDKECSDITEGVLERVDNWKEHVEWADVVVFDDIGFGADADKLRKQGKLVVGGSAYTDKLEDDREFGQEEMKAAGINILPRWNFTDFNDAIAFIKKNPDRYVLKPSGKAQNDKTLLFVGQEDDGRDLIQILEHYKKTWARVVKEFMLQKYASGVEVAVGAFFNGQEFTYPINVNFEHKKLFPGDVGPPTGEMGTSMFWSPSNEIFKETLGKMEAKLRESGYVGYIDVNAITNSRGIYPLEFTCRFGYPTINIQMEGILNNMGEFLHALAAKQKSELRTKKGFQIGVVIAVPPFPYEDAKVFQKYSEGAVVLFKKELPEGFHPAELKMIEDDWVIAGVSGYAMIITGSGSTMEDARKMAYNRVANIMVPNMFYRTDIGARWEEESDRLHTWGYLY